jgi:hypothetical protein
MKNSVRFWNWKGRFVSTYWKNNANPQRDDDGKRFVVHCEDELTAFLELESAIRATKHYFEICRFNRNGCGHVISKQD